MRHSLKGVKIARSWLLGAGFFLGLVEAGWSQESLPEGSGRDVVSAICTICHPLTNIMEARLDLQGWQAIVTRMVAEGAPLTNEEVETVAVYLAKNFGKEKQTSHNDSGEATQASRSKKVNLNTATASVALGKCDYLNGPSRPHCSART